MGRSCTLTSSARRLGYESSAGRSSPGRGVFGQRAQIVVSPMPPTSEVLAAATSASSYPERIWAAPRFYAFAPERSAILQIGGENPKLTGSTSTTCRLATRRTMTTIEWNCICHAARLSITPGTADDPARDRQDTACEPHSYRHLEHRTVMYLANFGGLRQAEEWKAEASQSSAGVVVPTHLAHSRLVVDESSAPRKLRPAVTGDASGDAHSSAQFAPNCRRHKRISPCPKWPELRHSCNIPFRELPTCILTY